MVDRISFQPMTWLHRMLRAFEVWLVISVVEVIHGIARVSLLEPITGDFRARQITVFSGSVLILAVTYLFRDWLAARDARHCIAVGAFWVFLTVAFEIMLGRAIMGLEWSRIASDYDVARGGLMPLGLLVMLFAPLIVTRRQ